MKNPDLFDNTRLSDFKRCPRYYFFRHVLDWVPNHKQLPLIFGSAWHKAMEFIWVYAPAAVRDGTQKELADRAFEEFLLEWETLGMARELRPDEEKDLLPRTPNVARRMIQDYIKAREYVFKNPSLQLVAVEMPFVVPLDPERDDEFYIGRIDKIARYQGKLIGFEHKTTSMYAKSGGFRSGFIDAFSPNSQVDGYQYALHLLYPKEDRGGVWVDAALVHRAESGYMFIPVERQEQMLDSWLWATRYWISLLQENRKALADVRPNSNFMSAFPQRTEACHDFGRACAYLDACKAWPNPLGKPMPINMKLEHWSPLDHIGPVKDIEQLLLTQGDGNVGH